MIKRAEQKIADDTEQTVCGVRITGITTGKIVDYGVRDSMNMGAAMAPAAADCIQAHLKDFSRSPSWYDKIITGDLGAVGREILLDLLAQKRSTLEAFIQIADWKSLTMKSRAQGAAAVAVAVRQSPCVRIFCRCCAGAN